MRKMKYDKTQFVTSVNSCLFRHGDAILKESSRTKECKSHACWTFVRLRDSPCALQELKDCIRSRGPSFVEKYGEPRKWPSVRNLYTK